MAFYRARQKAESPQWKQLSSRLKSRRSCRLINKLFSLCGPFHCRGGGLATGNGLGHFIEISSADKTLVPDCGITFFRAPELLFLKARIRRHAFARVPMREFKHAVIQGMEAGQRDELELVSHGGQLTLEFCDAGFIQLLLPVEGRRAVVRQQFAGDLFMDGFSEAPCLFDIWL